MVGLHSGSQIILSCWSGKKLDKKELIHVVLYDLQMEDVAVELSHDFSLYLCSRV